jgi:hypothetical protein
VLALAPVATTGAARIRSNPYQQTRNPSSKSVKSPKEISHQLASSDGAGRTAGRAGVATFADDEDFAGVDGLTEYKAMEISVAPAPL